MADHKQTKKNLDIFIYKPVVFNLNRLTFCTGLDIFAFNSATQRQRCHNEDRGINRLMNERLVYRQGIQMDGAFPAP